MQKFSRHSRAVIFGAGLLALGFVIWFWLTTWVSADFSAFPDSCPLHHVRPVREFVRNDGFETLSYGFDWIQVKSDLFPLDTFNDGYGHPDLRYRRILQKYCPECRRAREHWLLTRGRKDAVK